jgi:hypothetical protein
VANFVLAALAVVLAVTALPFHEAKLWFVATEFALIILVVVNTRIGQASKWHPRWFEAREVAERLRAGLLLWTLGARPASFFSSQEPTWTGWYARAILREQGLRSGSLDHAGLTAARSVMLNLLRDQCRYHVRTARRMRKLEHRLEWLGFRLFVATLVVAGLFLLFALLSRFAGWQPPVDQDLVKYSVTILTAGLPALATATYGIRVIGDFVWTARRSRRTRAVLRRVIIAIRQDPLELDLLRARAREAAEAMLGDVSSWRLSAESRGLAIPG